MSKNHMSIHATYLFIMIIILCKIDYSNDHFLTKLKLKELQKVFFFKIVKTILLTKLNFDLRFEIRSYLSFIAELFSCRLMSRPIYIHLSLKCTHQFLKANEKVNNKNLLKKNNSFRVIALTFYVNQLCTM